MRQRPLPQIVTLVVIVALISGTLPARPALAARPAPAVYPQPQRFTPSPQELDPEPIMPSESEPVPDLGPIPPSLPSTLDTPTLRDLPKTLPLAAYGKHPERFVRGEPSPAAPPNEVWINPPSANEPTSVADASNPALDLPPAGAVSRGHSAAALDAPPAGGYAGQGETREPVAQVVDAP